MLERSIKRQKYKSWKETVVRMAILTSIFSKLVIMMILFRCSGLGGDKRMICGHVETSESDECAKCQGSCNEGEEWLCCPVCHQ